ncbi:MAG: SGNH/GDSL hydrolase family protein [Candidatus Magnetominusculus sp. LBB02]|nr:SGNH/GDSL hydrolase family protein [Candidatus Magnetominusculus sp. LBB02]
MARLKLPGWKDAAALFIGCIVAAIAFEIFLRMYHPIHFTVRGDNITLAANESYNIENTYMPNLDKLISVRKNSIGFRGAEPPQDLSRYLSIIAVGGSTTECFCISEGKTWTDLLGNKLKTNFVNLWINNAGLAGHTTFGHYILIKNYIAALRPKVVLYLVGVNELNKTEISADELKIVPGHNAERLINYLAAKIETVYFLQNLYRYRQAGKGQLYTEHFDIHHEKISSNQDMPKLIQEAEKEHAEALSAYGQRLNKLIDVTIANSITPVLITQPILYGNAIDNSTGIDLGKLKYAGKFNGELMWHIMEMYNDVMRKTANERHIFLIDLSRQLNKDSSYYYDWLHFTNVGAERIADILYNELCPFLSEKYPQFVKDKCR